MPGSAYTVPAQPCRGVTRLGVRCRRTTRNVNGWCGRCDGSGRDEPPLGGTLTADQLGIEPEPLTLPERQAAVAAAKPVTARRVRWLLWRVRLADRMGPFADSDQRAAVLAVAAGDHGPLTANARRLLADHPDWQIRGAVIEHPDTTEADLWRALGDRDWRVVLVAAGHPNLPTEAADGLLDHSKRLVRSTAASNTACSPEALRRAVVTFGGGDRDLVLNVARNPATDAHTLDLIISSAARSLGTDPAAEFALLHQNCSPATLAQVAADPDQPAAFRAAAAANPNCPRSARAAHGLEAD